MDREIGALEIGLKGLKAQGSREKGKGKREKGKGKREKERD
jgi:hypothetical protein